MAEETGKKILIVEDEKPLASVLKLKLTNAGFVVRVVDNGEDALKVLAQEPFDLMLIDMIMPKRDGFSVLEELKRLGNPTPIFVMSNLGQEEDITRVRALGIKDYIVKADVSPAEILTRISAFFVGK